MDHLNYRFRDPALLEQALTHRSYAHEQGGASDNERLEFLGDAVLGLVVSHLLYEHFPLAAEGALTKLKSLLVSQRGLTRLAKKIDLGSSLRLGAGEEKSGGREKERLLAGAFEACIAAVYLDGGTQAACQLIKELLEQELSSLGLEDDDYKSSLQEKLQAEKKEPPAYRVLRTEGPDHARLFVIEVTVDSSRRYTGTGKSKAEAEQNAAKAALADLVQ
jgi:ribonuclease-3